MLLALRSWSVKAKSEITVTFGDLKTLRFQDTERTLEPEEGPRCFEMPPILSPMAQCVRCVFWCDAFPQRSPPFETSFLFDVVSLFILVEHLNVSAVFA